jgi:hypothetical protein
VGVGVVALASTAADHHSNVVALTSALLLLHLVFKKPSLNNLLGEKEGPAPSHRVRLSPFPPLPLLPELSCVVADCRKKCFTKTTRSFRALEFETSFASGVFF